MLGEMYKISISYPVVVYKYTITGFFLLDRNI